MKIRPPSARTRRYLYRVLVAAAPLAVLYGVATEAEVALWLGVAGAALGNALAGANTPDEA